MCRSKKDFYFVLKGQGRIEKTEIIEMASKHIRHLQNLNNFHGESSWVSFHPVVFTQKLSCHPVSPRSNLVIQCHPEVILSYSVTQK